MDFYREQLYKKLSKHIITNLRECIFHYEEIVQTEATKALYEIGLILQNDTLNDFDAIEQIVIIFEKYKLGAGTRHDF